MPPRTRAPARERALSRCYCCLPFRLPQRLLRLVESGLPEWAVFLPAYGLPYRRWLRQAAKAAWVVVGVLSFAAGFHDLCRNIPGAKHALAALYRVSGVPEARARAAACAVASSLPPC